MMSEGEVFRSWVRLGMDDDLEGWSSEVSSLDCMLVSRDLMADFVFLERGIVTNAIDLM